MQHGGDAEACTEALRVGGDGEQGLGCGLEQDVCNIRFAI